jgi:hypothetical protein
MTFGLLGAQPLCADTTSEMAAPASLEALFSKLADAPGVEARFEEEKTLALLAAPLRSRGRLYFLAPSTLLRRVEAPRAQDILVAGSFVRISDASGEQSVDLASRAEILPLVKSMLWILTGDREALEAAYHLDYRVDAAGGAAGGNGRWQIDLVPRNAPLSDLVRELRVAGHGFVADRLDLIETNGDRTLTKISDVDAARTFDSEERRALFGLESP